MYQDKEEKESEAGGLGAGSQMDFSLLAQWTTEVTSYKHHDAGEIYFSRQNKVPNNNKVKGTLSK